MNRLQFQRGVAAAAVTGIAGAPRLARAEATVRVGVSPTDTFAEGIYANGAGFFKEAGLDVQLVSLPNSGAMGAAVSGGSLDVATGNAISIASAREAGLPYGIIAPSAVFVAREPTTLLMVAQNAPYKTAKDLDGKIVATIELRGIMQASIRSWMTKNGGDPASLKFIEMPFSTMAAALTQGRVDAAMIAEPALTVARATTREIGNPYAAIADEWPLNVWFTTRDWIAKNPAAARTFVQVMSKTAAWANGHPRETGAMLQKVLPLSDAVMARMTRTRFGDRLTPGFIQPVLDTAVKYGVLKRPLDAATLLLRV